jgi:Rieske Fe-S protein
MPIDEDKYPPATGRRRFVKGVVGSAVLGGLAVAGGALVESATNPTGQGGGVTQYFGNTVVDGPAPRGMPQIPVELDDEGFLRGVWPAVRQETRDGQQVTVAELDLGGTTYTSEWYQYCGIQDAPGLVPDADQDDYFRYDEGPPYQWQQTEVSPGDRVNVDDFADYRSWGNAVGRPGLGKPAIARWRSQDVSEVLPVQIIRSQRIADAAQGDDWLAATTTEGFLAYLNVCTHFCCVPGYKTTGQSATFGAENLVYCPCHQSVYDPFEIEQQTFVAFPRTSE